MNSYKITLGSGSRTIQGKDINEAFKSLGYQNNFKVYPNGFNKFRIELEGTSPRMTEACLEAYVTQPNNNTMQGASPFELFILMDGANTNDLIAYVKGEKETFEPTFAEV